MGKQDKHCEDCARLCNTYKGVRGAVYGNCKIRRSQEKRRGRDRACKLFVGKEVVG